MRDIFESVQRVLEKVLAQALLAALTLLLPAAAFLLPAGYSQHTARLALLGLAGSTLLLLSSGLAFRARSYPRIHCARYGGGTKHDDVRKQIRRLVRRNEFHILVDNQTFGGADYDPCFGVPKSLTVEYSVHGCRKFKTAPEHQHIDLV